MSDAPQSTPSDTPATVTTAEGEPRPPRSSGAVLAILGLLVALPLLVVVLVLIIRGTSGGGDDLAGGVDDGRVQAVYMANDRVFFGNLSAQDGDWLVLENAFFLRRGAAEGTKDGEAATKTDLVPIQQEVGGDGDMIVNAREIVLVQNLAKDSQIAEQIDEAAKK